MAVGATAGYAGAHAAPVLGTQALITRRALAGVSARRYATAENVLEARAHALRVQADEAAKSLRTRTALASKPANVIATLRDALAATAHWRRARAAARRERRRAEARQNRDRPSNGRTSSDPLEHPPPGDAVPILVHVHPPLSVESAASDRPPAANPRLVTVRATARNAHALPTPVRGAETDGRSAALAVVATGRGAAAEDVLKLVAAPLDGLGREAAQTGRAGAAGAAGVTDETAAAVRAAAPRTWDAARGERWRPSARQDRSRPSDSGPPLRSA